jgi:nicotinamidase-related amidase
LLLVDIGRGSIGRLALAKRRLKHTAASGALIDWAAHAARPAVFLQRPAGSMARRSAPGRRPRRPAAIMKPTPRERANPGRAARPVVVPVPGTALLLIDVINDLAFPGAAGLIAEAEPMALRLRTLKRRAAAAGVPVVYINDNFGQWRSDFRQTVAHCTSRTSPGRLVSQRLRPTARDFFVLKPKHSGFYDTTLDTLLGALRVRRVILTGIAGNICVLFTANDAYMRELKIFVPSDCIVSNTAEENANALRQLATVMKANVTPSDRIRFGPGSRRPRPGRAAAR